MNNKVDNKDILFGHMEDLADKALKIGCSASRFLAPSRAEEIAARFSRRRGVAVCFDGGFEGAERVRAVFTNSDWGSYERSGLFAALKLTYRPQDAPGHRDILGALMALGIERDTVGDIVVLPPHATLICLPEISGYISSNLTKVGRVGISVSGAALAELPAGTESLEIKTDTVASLRLDAVLCAAFGLSRGRASEIIAAGLACLNHNPCLSPAREVSEGAILSVRGLGRAKLVEIGGVSRKGRRFINIGLYGR